MCYFLQNELSPFSIFITLQCRGKIECSVAESCVLLIYIPFKTVREFLMNPGEKDALSNAKVSLKTDTFFIDFNIKMFKKRAKYFFLLLLYQIQTDLNL